MYNITVGKCAPPASAPKAKSERAEKKAAVKDPQAGEGARQTDRQTFYTSERVITVCGRSLPYPRALLR